VDFRLSDEQVEWQKKCHAFARDVMRPAADQYDRSQDTPWDVIEAAADAGLYGLDYIQAMGSDPGGLFGVIYAEETHWGCAGIALAISATGLAAAGIASSGTPEQIGRWVPECFGTKDEIKLGAYCVTEAGAGSDVKALRTTA
jgi:alkylation response protein AidB-like acyl-CoA dehydrogenase